VAGYSGTWSSQIAPLADAEDEGEKWRSLGSSSYPNGRLPALLAYLRGD
jgi:hypothetical protein